MSGGEGDRASLLSAEHAFMGLYSWFFRGRAMRGANGQSESDSGMASSGSLPDLTKLLGSGSFHDESRWEKSRWPATTTPGGGGRSASEEFSVPRPTEVARTRSTHWVAQAAPMLSNQQGTALSTTGVAAISTIGALTCHAARLILRDLFEQSVLRSGIPRASWRTLELYLLSLLHSGTWIGFALRSLLTGRLRKHLHQGGTLADSISRGSSPTKTSIEDMGPHEHGGGVRALGLSAGFHWCACALVPSLQSLAPHELEISLAHMLPHASTCEIPLYRCTKGCAHGISLMQFLLPRRPPASGLSTRTLRGEWSCLARCEAIAHFLWPRLMPCQVHPPLSALHLDASASNPAPRWRAHRAVVAAPE